MKPHKHFFTAKAAKIAKKRITNHDVNFALFAAFAVHYDFSRMPLM